MGRHEAFARVWLKAVSKYGGGSAAAVGASPALAELSRPTRTLPRCPGTSPSQGGKSPISGAGEGAWAAGMGTTSGLVCWPGDRLPRQARVRRGWRGLAGVRGGSDDWGGGKDCGICRRSGCFAAQESPPHRSPVVPVRARRHLQRTGSFQRGAGTLRT